MRIFETDYIVSWDFSDKDCPCVSVSRLREENGKLMCDVLGMSYKNSGVVSLRQVIEEFDNEKGMYSCPNCGAKMDEEEAP